MSNRFTRKSIEFNIAISENRQNLWRFGNVISKYIAAKSLPTTRKDSLFNDYLLMHPH